MYAQCPQCRTTFAISAEALRTAHGKVRCGACLEAFDAIATLRDADPLADTPSRSAAPPATDAEAVPEVLREDLIDAERARRARLRSTGFTLASLFLCVVLVAQYAWFQPGELLARYPRAQPLIAQLCARTGCRLPERRDPLRITVLSRDVRVHPRYEGALRVTAQLMNTAPFAQPYPRMRFALYNVNGQTIASRVFEPSQYLGRRLAPHAEMAPSVPVQVALDLLAPEEAAVSFEFRFL